MSNEIDEATQALAYIRWMRNKLNALDTAHRATLMAAGKPRTEQAVDDLGNPLTRVSVFATGSCESVHVTDLAAVCRLIKAKFGENLVEEQLTEAGEKTLKAYVIAEHRAGREVEGAVYMKAGPKTWTSRVTELVEEHELDELIRGMSERKTLPQLTKLLELEG